MTAITKPEQSAIIESVVVHGDLSKLSAAERTSYYARVCESVGVNPLTKPFEYLRLNGREVLYATRTCTDQLRGIHGVSIRITARENVGDVYVVTASATNREGRVDESTGAVVVGALKGESLANALMKAETKAKRRVTLSICGLGMLDESELDTIPVSAIDTQYIDERAEAQARAKNEGDRFAEELIAMFPTIVDRETLDRWIHFNGYEVQRMHTNGKQRLWRALGKHIEATGIKIDGVEMRKQFTEAPQPTEEI